MAEAVLDAYRAELLSRYREQVEDYRRHLAALDPATRRAPIKPGEWSPHQLLFHVAAVDEQSYGPRLLRILEENRPALDDFDQEAWMTAHYRPDLPVETLLGAWESARGKYARALEAAPPSAWSRTGTQPYWGERTLQWWLERAVTHGGDHWRQLHGE